MGGLGLSLSDKKWRLLLALLRSCWKSSHYGVLSAAVHARPTKATLHILYLLPPQPLTEVLSGAVASYGRRNLRLACDAISTLAEAAGPRLGAPELVSGGLV